MSETLLPFPWLDLVLILALIALNGVLAMSEMAIVSSREARLRAMAKGGSKGAAGALSLSAEPGRFLSTVQIGITLIGILNGAFSGATLSEPVGQRIALLGLETDTAQSIGFGLVILLTTYASLVIGITLIGILNGAFSGATLSEPVGQRLALLGLEPDTAQSIGFGLVILLTTYASLVIGELVPKQFALRSPEPIAAVVARPMIWLARLTAPLVWLLDVTSAAIFRALGMNREAKNVVTAEELHLVVAEAKTAGVLEENERAIISGIVRLADRPVREVMTPRTEIDWIDVDSDREQVRTALLATPHSRLPVARGSVDDIVGVISTRDLLMSVLDGAELDLGRLARNAPVIPDLMDAMDALGVLRSAEVPLALVHDEYGHLDGIVTPGSILAALAGAFASDLEHDDDPPCVEREDGSWLVAGAANADLLIDRLGIALPGERDYSTVAGFALDVLRHLPETGEKFEFDNWSFEVVDMDGRKIDKLLASRRGRGKAAMDAGAR